jgi:putative acetyltransferase
MQYTLRPATNNDRAEIETLVFGILAEYGLCPDPAGIDSDLHDLRASYETSGGAFDVLVDDAGKVVGSVGLLRVSASICELRKMYLARPVRGQGWGRRLLEHALNRATQLGFARVVLETATILSDAIALYERYGFRPYKPDHFAGRCDKAYYLDLKPIKACS